MKKLIPLIIIIALVQLSGSERLNELFVNVEHMFGQSANSNYSSTATADAVPPTPNVSSDDAILARAFAQQQDGIQVQGRGRITRILADDNEGSAHQRFIVSLDSGQTLLIAHNIELAPRLASIKKGETIEFYGEYAWTEQGGVIHWTHRDPQRRHVAGWLRYAEMTYQ